MLVPINCTGTRCNVQYQPHGMWRAGYRRSAWPAGLPPNLFARSAAATVITSGRSAGANRQASLPLSSTTLGS